ncbi:protein kinase domain-containing protein [Endozoicomonas acroporae]|uniref:protein kinase domain-containing protein n=1 Tax=Endozoicomonas acroporae TaxID=1701104 RepID=UPI0013D64190|nr:hypothetical protein [Endozoicomonas acroporae]
MKITKSMIDHPHRIKEPTPEKQGSWQGRNLKELALACKKKLQRVYAYIRYKDLTIKDYNPADFVLHIALCPPGYRSPDDLIFQNVNLKAEDAWSLGVLLTEMFAGKRYFYRSDLSDTVETIKYKLNGRDKAIAEMVRMGVNPKAIRLAQALLHHNPSQRMTVAEALKSPFLEEVDLAAFGA